MRRFGIGVAVAVALSLAPLAAVAEATAAAGSSLPPGVTATAAPDKVRLGEPFHYVISVTRPANERFDLAPPGDLGAFSLRGLERRRQDGPHDATTTFDLTLAVYDLGAQPLPSLTLDAVLASGRTHLLVRGPSVTAIRVSKPGEKLSDIAGPVQLFERSLGLVFAALGLCLLGAGATLAIRRWRRRPRSLAARSRLALDMLARAELVEAGRTQEFFFALDDIVRRYIGERFALEALECTTRELVGELRAIDALAPSLDEIVHFLAEADLVKFARASADRQTAADALAFAYRLVALPVVQPIEKGIHAQLAVS
ncbi:MAG TPA: hypothetical protein VGL86_29355 [Polyangia bacterium]|jgi:hypothetical protein